MILFGIGITYGIKDTKITFLGKIVIFIISFLISIISLYFGNIVKYMFPDYITKSLGSFIFILAGIFMFFQALQKDKDIKLNSKSKKLLKEKTYSFFIKFLGITIKIIKDPTNSDLDNSNKIDYKEAIFLSLALSIDSICIGIGSSIIGINNLIFPFLISFFQLLFLKLGFLFGKNLYKNCNLPKNIWSIISSILLISIGILKLII